MFEFCSYCIRLRYSHINHKYIIINVPVKLNCFGKSELTLLGPSRTGVYNVHRSMLLYFTLFYFQ